jgi:hypothetical protein
LTGSHPFRSGLKKPNNNTERHIRLWRRLVAVKEREHACEGELIRKGADYVTCTKLRSQAAVRFPGFAGGEGKEEV